ncbi:MAG: PAS domain S-box protein [Phycisphaerae bacterium]|nr:PAS domain S-box protein [Phycisphaerae bacterium]NUQ46189.1 PAS domain S-box protein [Phycisphaerae bacterium]
MGIRRLLEHSHAAGLIDIPHVLVEAVVLAVSIVGVAAVVGIGRLVSERDVALGALRRERDLSDSIINSLPGVFYLYDESLTFQRWNRNFERVTGFDAEEMKGRHPLDFFIGEQRQMLAEKIEQVFRTGAGEAEADFVCKDGRRIPYYFNGARVEIDGRPCLIGMGIDIAARKEMERELELSSQRLRLAVEGAAIGTWHWRPSSGEMVWSPRGYAILGQRSGGDMSYDRFLAALHVDDRARTDAAIRCALEGGTPYRIEFRTVWPDGTVHFVAARGQAYYDENGRPVRMEGVVLDITDQKAAEERLREQQQLLQLFVEHSPAAIAMFDSDMRYLVASRRWHIDYRLGESSLVGRSHYDVFPELPQRWRDVHRRCLAGAVERCEEDAFQRVDGSTDWVRWEARPWHTAGGDVGGLIIFSEVITERKSAQEALREADIRLRLAARAANVGLWDWDLRTNRVFYSPEWKSQLGYADEEISDAFEEWRSRVHPDDLAPTLRTIHDFVANPTSGYTTEFRMRHRDRSYRWILTNASMMCDAEGKPDRLLGCHVDITERKRNEQKLAESERRLRDILDSLQAFVGLLSPDGVLLDANRAAYERAGLRRQDVVGRPLVDSYWISHSPAVQARFADAIQRAGAGETVHFETTVRMAGERLITIDFSLVPLRDSNGIVTNLVPSGIDITERKRAESALRESRERLALLSRQLMSAHETERRSLARELHDEIGQVLTAVHINLQQARTVRDARATARLDQSVDIVSQAIQRVRDMSLNLRPAMLDDFGLVAAVRWYADRVRQTGGLDIELRTHTSGEELPSEISTACFRIVQEALTNVQRHAGARRVLIELSESDEVIRVSVTDDGVGFDVDAARRRAMQAVSFGIIGMQERVELLGGEFALSSTPGEGTCVRARLPLTAAAAPHARPGATGRGTFSGVQRS